MVAESTRSYPDNRGVVMRQRECKLSLFVDDILLTITNPLLFLASLHSLLSSFSAISGYKINTKKTEALPLHIPHSLPSQLKESYPYRWCSTSLKYLVVHITPTYSSLCSVNYPTMIADINTLLQSWTKYPLSLLGRVNILKMSILPRFLYYFETLPVAIPPSQLKAIQRCFQKLIWNGKAHRISSLVVLSLRSRGAWGLRILLNTITPHIWGSSPPGPACRHLATGLTLRKECYTQVIHVP